MIGDGREEKKEFCRDVSSFANDSGGHLIIGIDEEQGLPNRLSGLAVANTDAEISRLEQMLKKIDFYFTNVNELARRCI